MPSLAVLLKETNLFAKDPVRTDVELRAVTDDSRRADADALFVAVPGAKADGHLFLADAAARGCRVALVMRNDVKAPPGLELVRVDNTRRALALMAEALAGYPSRRMLVLGVTGTNGKTTTTYLLESILRAAGRRPGVIGTINYRWDSPTGPVEEVANNTTPSPVQISNYLARMLADGVDAVAMEVSSHALDQSRVDGIKFDAAAFTNLTQDHLDYHRTMEAYTEAKERLFTVVTPGNPRATAVLNIDEPAGRRYAERHRCANLLRYSIKDRGAELHVRRIEMRGGWMRLVTSAHGRELVLDTQMPGLHNAMNCLTAAGLALAAGLPDHAIQEGIAHMPGAPGRFEFVRAGQPFPVIVDYAHTPDALLQVLINARGFARRRLFVIFGCGGDRDPGKRGPMGQAAARLGDELIITNDNPRGEEPAKIAEAIVEGVKSAPIGAPNYRVVLDRREAIGLAVGMAREGDAIVIAGKGHEDYQILGPNKIHFDDREEARAALKKKGYPPA